MRFYLDDDATEAQLVQLLRRDGHDVELPIDVKLSGEDDAVHLTYSVKERHILLSRNHKDFRNLHNLVMQVGGHHPGIFIGDSADQPISDRRYLRLFATTGSSSP